jgi:hypothetical protein
VHRPAGQPAAFGPEVGCYHWPVPVPLNLRVVLTARLSQSAAPWPREICLRVNSGNDGAYLNVAVRDVERAATSVGGLLGAAAGSVAAATPRRLAARPAVETR